MDDEFSFGWTCINAVLILSSVDLICLKELFAVLQTDVGMSDSITSPMRCCISELFGFNFVKN